MSMYIEMYTVNANIDGSTKQAKLSWNKQINEMSILVTGSKERFRLLKKDT